MNVAVIAHTGKTLGGGLGELRQLLASAGYDDPVWYEVPKSRKAPKKAAKVRDAGVDLVFVWGGDGMVQRCVDVFAGSDVAVAILPAGTANLLASNLGIPTDLAEAVRVGLHGDRRRLDLGKLNGEHFAVMAGAGFDGAMIRDADGDLKSRLGKLAYVWTGSTGGPINTLTNPVPATASTSTVRRTVRFARPSQSLAGTAPAPSSSGYQPAG